MVPLLKKYDMKATISIVGYYSEVTAQADPHIPEYSYLTWEDISELVQSGYIEIANHTYNLHSDKGRKGCSKLSYETEDEYADTIIEDIGLLPNSSFNELQHYSGSVYIPLRKYI